MNPTSTHNRPDSPSDSGARAEALERLRALVERAATEITRLRRQNAALEARVEKLEANPGLDHDGALLTLDEPPEQLRQRIERFIDAIDDHLAQHASSE